MPLFSPLINLGQGFWGFVLVFFLGYAFLYTFGISTWVIYPVESAIALPAIAENQANFEAGKEVVNIFTIEAGQLFLLGGGGATLALCIMLAFMAKSQRLKMIGKASLIPSIFNINEPIVFGAPVAFNPILMIPMWINGLVGPYINMGCDENRFGANTARAISALVRTRTYHELDYNRVNCRVDIFLHTICSFMDYILSIFQNLRQTSNTTGC